MRAVILAGGIGSRLRPYTLSLPKPLLPVGDKPILEIIVQQLAKFGFNHLTMAVNHQADLFSAYFGDGGKWGVPDHLFARTPSVGDDGTVAFDQ